MNSQTRGEHYEGQGGPIDKLQESYERQPGQDDNDVVPANVPKTGGLGSVQGIATQGQEASVSNVGRKAPGVGGSQFKGEDYYTPESVTDSISAEGNVAPGSVTQASRESEGY
jgi:hypothetical protein